MIFMKRIPQRETQPVSSKRELETTNDKDREKDGRERATDKPRQAEKSGEGRKTERGVGCQLTLPGTTEPGGCA